VKNVEKFWRLDSPAMCRDFLKSVRMGPKGSKITELTQADGKVLSIDEASDAQVLELANDLADAMKQRPTPK
jgi:hypothetical protein